MKRDGRYQAGVIATAVIILEVIGWAVWLAAFWIARTQVPSFRFARPWILWGMLVGLLLLMIYLLDLAWKNRALARFGSSVTLPRMVPGISSSSRSLFRFLLTRHGLSFVIIALAGPQLGTRMEEVKAKGVDVVVALDVSNSMLAEDLKPSRMESARRALEQLIDQLHGDRLGIIVFAGEAYVQLPLTADRSAASLFLHSIGPGMVPTQGTAIGAAIELAQKSFDDQATSKSIVVITDGENHEDDAEGAARAAYENGVIVNAIGMGTAQGAPIPVRQGDLVVGFKKDKDGGTVISRLNEGMLQRIAAEGHGQYVRATSQDAGIQPLMDELRKMDQSETGTYRYAGHEDRYRFFLAIGIIMILLSIVMSERRPSGSPWLKINLGTGS